MNKKKLLYIILLLSKNNIDLANPNNPTPGLTHIEEQKSSTENSKEVLEANDEERIEEELLKTIFTLEELNQFKIPLKDRLNEIEKNNYINNKKKNNKEIKKNEVLQATQIINQARYTIEKFSNNITFVDIISKQELNNLPIKDYRNIGDNFKAKEIVNDYTGKWISNIIDIINDTITDLDTKSIEDKDIIKKYTDAKNKLEETISKFTYFKSNNNITDKHWFDLRSTKDIGLDLLDNDLLEKIDIKENENKGLFKLVDIQKIIQNNAVKNKHFYFIWLRNV